MMEFNHFAQIGEALESAAQTSMQTIGSAAVQHIQEHIQANGQIRTGYMLNSVTSDGETVTVGADYAVYQNYGTRYLPARPFFEPGLDDTEADIDSAVKDIVTAMEGAA